MLVYLLMSVKIEYARSENLLAVEMEAAALYAFAEARDRPVVCFAHVTNAVAAAENDFEKGVANGNEAFVALITAVARLRRGSVGRRRCERMEGQG